MANKKKIKNRIVRYLNQNNQLEKIPSGVLRGPEQYAPIKITTLGEKDSHNHQNILKTYRNTV